MVSSGRLVFKLRVTTQKNLSWCVNSGSNIYDIATELDNYKVDALPLMLFFFFHFSESISRHMVGLYDFLSTLLAIIRGIPFSFLSRTGKKILRLLRRLYNHWQGRPLVRPAQFVYSCLFFEKKFVGRYWL